MKEGDFPIVNNFKVGEFSEHSDHAPVLFSIKCKHIVQGEENMERESIKWNDSLIDRFRNGIIGKLPIFNRLLENQGAHDNLSINELVNQFSDILREVADPLFKKVYKRAGHTYKTQNGDSNK